MSSQISKLDWNDTFLDRHHLEASFPGSNVEFESAKEHALPPYMYVRLRQRALDRPFWVV